MALRRGQSSSPSCGRDVDPVELRVMILVKAAPVLTSRLDESMCGSSIRIDGTVAPPIIGVPLNGTNGSAAIPDTDNGSYDRDTVWDRAVGPFQFIPSSWAIYGQDGNGDGDRNPNNVYDAVPAVVAHLCPTGTVTDIEAAIFAYNRSTAYVQLVLEWAAWLEQARDPTPPAQQRGIQ